LTYPPVFLSFFKKIPFFGKKKLFLEKLFGNSSSLTTLFMVNRVFINLKHEKETEQKSAP